ncbi:LysR substrate-binding domain-containing protein [Aeromicrobium sp. SORGH_AS_0981]|uniref:LysR substrate-binding domain-containing protein n=1 Tax=Aeromicrobium sp. SORGH_AS_0981 TaxID=3041802 RepID=UPI00286BB434|nr:LysR substrate-binding domain-containing protein [Aeromicrobium sp. SORGH_AS_0981]
MVTSLRKRTRRDKQKKTWKRSSRPYDGRVLNVQRLRVLQAVVAAGSVSAAARNLSYAPATVSQHVALLARESGLVLFEKQGRGIVPTAAALHLVERAAPVLADLERLDRVALDLREGRVEGVAIACFASVAQAWIPAVATALAQQHPRTTLEVSLNEPHDGRGRRPPDVIVQTEPLDGRELHHEGYRRHVLAFDEFSVVLPAGHALASWDEVPMAELRDEAWVDHDIYDSPTGRIIRDACGAAGFSPFFAARLDDHHAALALVASGLGVTVIPDLALTGRPPGLEVRRVVRPAVARRVTAHVRVDAHRQGVLSVVVSALRSAAAAGSSPPPR